MAQAVEERATRNDVLRQLARLAALYADSRPDPAMYEEYVSMALDLRWDAAGLEAATTEHIRLPDARFFPKPGELRALYDTWRDKQAAAAGWLGLGTGWASAPNPALPSGDPDADARGSRLLHVQRKLADAQCRDASIAVEYWQQQLDVALGGSRPTRTDGA